MTSQTPRDAEITAKMTAAGFALADMGGNTQAWRRDVSDNQHVLITCGEDGTEIYGDPDAAEWLACSYFHDRPEYVEGEDNGAVTLDGALTFADARK